MSVSDVIPVRLDAAVQTATGTELAGSGSVGRAAWALILAFGLAHLLLAVVLPLTPQEAYYWLWSRDLAWSYFDHPPLVAWSIAAATAVFGPSSWAIKLAAVGWSLAFSVVWARLVIDIGGSRSSAFWTLLALNLIGIVAAYGVVIAPDAPLLFAWAAVTWTVLKATRTGETRWWLLAGLALGLGFLAKYTAVLLVPAVGIYLVLSPSQRHWLRRPQPWLALIIAAIVFTPVIAWNAQHDWASFAFQSTQRAVGMDHWRVRYLLQLLGTQFIVATPYLFVLALATWWTAVRGWRALLADDTRLLLVASATVPLLLFAFASLRSLVKPNWLAPVYPPLIVLALHAQLKQGAVPRALKIGLASSAAVLCAAAAAVTLPNPWLGVGNTWSGWTEAAQRVDQWQHKLAAENTASFVFSTNYKNSAMLAFNLPGHPRTYAQDIYGERALQFDYWPPEATLAGRTGILVIDDRRDAAQVPQSLLDRFQSVEKVDTVFVGDPAKPTRRIDIYLCRGYRGHPHSGRSS